MAMHKIEARRAFIQRQTLDSFKRIVEGYFYGAKESWIQKILIANRIPPRLYKVEINAEASRSGKTLRLSVFGPVWACQLTKIQRRPFLYTSLLSFTAFLLQYCENVHLIF